MSASFKEKSVWIQLIGLIICLAAYLYVAGQMFSSGVTELVPYVPVFAVAVTLMVVLMVIGHILVAITGRTEENDERDRLISWRAENNSSWVLAVGVLSGITCMVLSVDDLWTAHVLLLSLFLSEMLGFILRIIYYRRGM